MKTILSLFFVFFIYNAFGATPNISYSSGVKIYNTGLGITPLTPTNTGDPVTTPATVTTVVSLTGQAQTLAFNAAKSILYVPLSNKHFVQQITLPSTVSTLAGTLSTTGSYFDGTGIDAKFNSPYGIAVHPNTGDVYIADQLNNRIRRITTGGVVTTYAGTGTAASTNGSITTASINSPRGLAFDTDGTLFVLEAPGYAASTIRKINSEGTSVSTLFTDFTNVYVNPWGFTYCKGYFYISEVTGNKINKIKASTGISTVLAGNGTIGLNDGIGNAATFNSPSGVAVDDNGFVYVADYSNSKIRRINPSGDVKVFVGSGLYANNDGIGTGAGIQTPGGLAFDDSGNLYVSSIYGNNIRKIVVNSYSITPALPAGLIFDGTTGIISGVPTEVSPVTEYSITAKNTSGISQTKVTIQVNSGEFTYTPLSLSNIFGNNMVIQQDTEASFWGWGTSGRDIVITASWGQTVTVKAGVDCKWSAKIQTPKAVPGTAPKYTLTFEDINSRITLNNILVGDIWICSGQSNMEYPMKPPLSNSSIEIANANYPNIRLFSVVKTSSKSPSNNCIGGWNECSPATVLNFSAVAYFFGREIYNTIKTKIPIGLVMSAYGGSTCQAWTKRDVLAADPVLKTNFLDPYDASPTLTGSTTIYNSMIAPLIPFSIKGFLWYQGESNAVNGSLYSRLCTAMLQDWRTQWGKPDLPFYYVQIAPWGDFVDLSYGSAILREAQSNMLTVANTGMAVTIDLADDVTNIHPINKQDVGKRMALLALSKTYGENVLSSGPVLKSYTIQGSRVRITYNPETIGLGLTTIDGSYPKCFRIAGVDKKFYNASAVIDGNEIVVSSPLVTIPIAVRYAFSNAPVPNLRNIDGLPAYPFRTDSWTDAVYQSNIVNASDELTYDNTIQIFPTQFEKEIFIKCATGIKRICLSNSTGTNILEYNYNIETSQISIKTEKLISGIFLLTIKSNDGKVKSFKIIKN